MSYDPAHNYWVAFNVETGDVTESSDGTTPAALPSAPDSYTFCGYLAVPDQTEGNTNSVGYSIGSAFAQYKKSGSRAPMLTLVLKGLGGLSLLDQLTRLSDALPQLCFWAGIPGVETHRFRLSKIGKGTIACQEAAQGEASEIEITLEVQAIAWEDMGSPVSPSLNTLLAALTAPMFWHDVRTFSVTDADGTTTDYRGQISGFTFTIDQQLKRLGQRPNFGADEPLSRTNYVLQEGVVACSGEMQFHGLISNAMFTGAANSFDWGDIAVVISDSPSPDPVQTVAITMGDCIPTIGRQISAADAAAELGYRIPFAAKTYTGSESIAD